MKIGAVLSVILVLLFLPTCAKAEEGYAPSNSCHSSTSCVSGSSQCQCSSKTPTIKRARSRWSITAKAGLTSTRFAGPGANSANVHSNSKVGWAFGGGVAFRIHRFVAGQTNIDISGQSELGLTNKGAKSDSNGSFFGTYSVNYIEAPVLARVSALFGTTRLMPYMLLGPAFGFSLGMEVETADGMQLDLADRFYTFDMGLLAGVGIARELGERGSLAAEVRYNLGLRNIDKTGGPGDEGKNRALYVLLGYQY